MKLSFQDISEKSLSPRRLIEPTVDGEHPLQLASECGWANVNVSGIPPPLQAIAQLSKLANTGFSAREPRMRTFTSADAKNNFGELIDLARAAPVAVTKYDRAVVVVMAVEEYERLCDLLDQAGKPRKPTKSKRSGFMIQKTGKKIIRARQTNRPSKQNSERQKT